MVAVKVLRPEVADDPEFRARFRREVAALTRVSSACTVRVIEADTESPRPFMVTEYVAGPSLSEYVERYGPLDPGMLYDLATGLAQALTAIHAAGIVHRDLKPSNVILTKDGPKVIDFGIAQALGATSVTRTGMIVGSAAFLAPEQVTGRAGPAADIFAWGVTLGCAASGESPFGTGTSDTIVYRILYGDPDIAAVPETLRPLVEAALAKDPHRRPAARELLDQLAIGSARPGVGYGTHVAPGPARILPGTDPSRVQRPEAAGALLLEPPSSVSRPLRRKRRRAGRTAAVVVPAVALATAAAVAIALLTGHGPRSGQLAADQGTKSAATLPMYPGHQQRGVFQGIDRIVSDGNTIVTTGSQSSDGLVRQQFFVSTDGGANWRLATEQAAGGGEVPLGHAATRIAAGAAGWAAVGPEAIWTSKDGLSWTLAAAHGITPQLPGDQVWVITNTADGFLAGGVAAAPGGGTQAVLWLSRDGVSWRRLAVAQLGLAPGQTVTSISYAASRGSDTVISGTIAGVGPAVWLSTDGGSSWTRTAVPVDHGAADNIAGLSFDESGLLAVRPGVTAEGAADGVAYFSPNGRAWRYAGTIDGAGGWSPGVVKGSSDGFVVTGQTAAGAIVAYTSTGGGGTWTSTGSLGSMASESMPSGTVAPGGTMVMAGSTTASKVGQQAVLMEARPGGGARRVSLVGIPGAVVPELAVDGMAAAGGVQVAVGSADGYPAIWRRDGSEPWALVSSSAPTSGQHRLAALTGVTHGARGWLAVGVPGPLVYTSSDGVTWRPAVGGIAQDLAGVVAVAAAAGPRGYVIVGKLITPGGGCVGDDWWSPDLASWTRAQAVNDVTGSSQVLAVAADPHGFISVGSHDGEPAMWTTSNGRTWATIMLSLPRGASSAVLQQVAVSGDREAALGQQVKAGRTVPFAEVSTDGGRWWHQVPFGSPGPDTAFTALIAGSGGFTAAAQYGQPGQPHAAAWTSTTGAAWTRAQTPALAGAAASELAALAASGSTATGIGMTAIQQSQRPVAFTVSPS
jgi:Protein kinase domain